jgi:molecular chaperone DnaK (HSP70)
MLKHLAIDLGTTNTLIAARDDEGEESLVHLPRISQIQAALSAQSDTPYTLVPSEVFHSDDGPEIGARAWATLERDETPDAYRRYSRNFKRQLLDSFLQARHSEDGHRSLLEASTDFVRLLCDNLLYELEQEYGSRQVPNLILTAPVQAPAEYRAWLREVFQVHLQPTQIQLIDESTAAALFYGHKDFGSRILIVDIGGSTSDITLADLGFGGDGLPIEASLIVKSGKLVGGSAIDDLVADKAFEVQGLNPPASFNRKSYLRAIRAGEKVKKKLSISKKAFEAYEDLQTGLTINMHFKQDELTRLVSDSAVGSGLRQLVRETTEDIQQRGIDTKTIRGAVLVGGCTLCPPIRAILEDSFAQTGLELFDFPSEADRFAAVVLGALRSVDAPVSNDYLLHDYALRLKANNGNTIYQTLFSRGAVIPCRSEYTLHSSKRSANQVGIKISVGELFRQPRQLPDTHDQSESEGPLVASDFRPLGTEGHLVVIPVDPLAPVGQRRYRISFGIDSERQLRITADDTVIHKRLLDNVIISDLKESASVSSELSPAATPASAVGSARPQRILELNPNPSYNSLEIEVASVLGDMSMEGYLISNVILDGRTLYEVDHLLVTPSGQAYIIECKNYKGTWTGGINSQWICTGPDGSERIINAKPVNPMLQCRRYIGDVLRRLGSAYPEYQFSKACLVIAPDQAHLEGVSGCDSNLMNVSRLPGFVQRMEERRQSRPCLELNPDRLKDAFYLS